jgi:hypothetical protein
MNSALLFFDFARRSPFGTFHRILQLMPTHYGGNLELKEIKDDLSVVEASLPPWCNDRISSLCGVLAMMDEISTYSGVVPWDQYNRPGVSLQMSARCLNPIEMKSGDRVVFQTQLQKIGKTIGFVDVLASDVHGRPFLSMQHIKFMSTLPSFHLWFHPVFQNLTVPISHSLLPIVFTLPQNEPSIPSKVEDIYDLKQSTIDLNTNKVHFTTTIEKNHGNPLGALHGGAAVVLSGLAASRTISALTGKVPIPTAMRITLLNGIPATSRQLTIESTYCPITSSSRTLLIHNNAVAVDSEVDW